jgi:hypothetical protein
LSEKKNLLKELAPGSVDWDLLKAEIEELEKQVLVLRREEMITRFVEDSVRMTAATNEMLEGGDEMEFYDDENDWKPSGLAELDDDES